MAIRWEVTVHVTMEAGIEGIPCTLDTESNQSNDQSIALQSTGTQSSAIHSPLDDGDAMEGVIRFYEDDLVRAMDRLSLYDQ